MFLDKGPVDLDAQTRQVVQVDHTLTHFWTRCVHAMLNRVAFGVAVRLDAKGSGPERRHEMAMDMRCGVGRDGHAVLLGHVGDTQGFREASMTGRIELYEANGPRGDKIADAE